MEKAYRQPRSPETPEQHAYVREWTEPSREDSPMDEISTQDRFRGCLLGLAAGDALGTTLEFKSPGTFEPIDDMVGGGPFNLQPGQWTDDTSMALCLATSLIEREGFDARDQMERYVRWWKDGYLSSHRTLLRHWHHRSAALSRFERDGDPYAGSTDPNSAGNGSLMRLAPVAMHFAADVEDAVEMAASSSMTTHGAREAVDACRYFATLLVGALEGDDKETLLAPNYWPVWWDQEPEPLAEKIARIAEGSFKDRNPPDIRGTGYVVDALEAALWAFHHSQDFREGALLAVNLGDDADTTAAIYGQIAGAYYGAESIPVAWRDQLTMAAEITSLADSLHDHAQEHMPPEPDVGRVRPMASITEQSGEMAGVHVRWVSVIVEGHTVEQVLFYDVAEAEAVFGRRSTLNWTTRCRCPCSQWLASRRTKRWARSRPPSATSSDGKCIRTAKIEHCNDIMPASASWSWSRADGTPVEREPWSCVRGTPPISHRELTNPGDHLGLEAVPRTVVREFEARLDEYTRDYKALLRRGLANLEGHRAGGGPGTIPAAGESTVTTMRYVASPMASKSRSMTRFS